jgi:hypothetical protein
MGLMVWQLREAERAGRLICCECGKDCDPKMPLQVQGMHYCDDHRKEYEKHVGYTQSNSATIANTNKEKGTDREKRRVLPVQPKLEYCPSCGKKKLKKDILIGMNGYGCKNESCKLFFYIEAITMQTAE